MGGINNSFMYELYLQQSVADKLEDLGIEERILNLDDAAFGGNPFEFQYFAKETMKRYILSNPELYKLKLKMTINNDDSASLATELIMDALNLSVKKLHIEFSYGGKRFVLPEEVLESGTLKELFATHCVISCHNVACSSLVSLKLICVAIGDDMMRDTLSGCPLLEKFSISECGMKKISLGKMQHNLKECFVNQYEDGCIVDFFEQGFTIFPNLTWLKFAELNLPKTFFQDSMVKFPCLTHLSLSAILGFGEIVEISLPSLKYLEMETMVSLIDSRWVFNLPNICKFKCSDFTTRGAPPLLYISTSSNQWESADIEFECCEYRPRSWFLRLREILQNLRVAKSISLGLRLSKSYEDESCIDKLTEEDISGVPCIHVKNLAFEDLLKHDSISLSAFSDLVRGLFSTCRPNFITVIENSRHPQTQPSGKCLPALELLCQSISKHAHWKCDLKQVTFEMLFSEGKTQQWRPIIWDDLIASVSLKIEGFQIRFKLEWQGGLN